MNIFQLSEEFLYLLQDIEDAEGEITEELAERLAINKEDFSKKMDGYAKIIRSLQGNVETIKDEAKRLSDLKVSTENKIDKMKQVMNEALKLFGEVGKTGNQTFKTGTNSFWNVYHKPLVITDETKVPEDYLQYDLKTHLPEEAMKDIADTLADYELLAITFDSSIKRDALKKAVENGTVNLPEIYIDMNASYLRIK